MAQAIPLAHNTKDDIWQNTPGLDGANQDRNFMESLDFGKKFSDTVAWSPAVNTIHDALNTLNSLYQTICSDGVNLSYHYEKIGDNSAKMDCQTDHPSDFDYGILYGIILKFRDENSSQVVVRRDKMSANGQNGDNACTYYLAW